MISTASLAMKIVGIAPILIEHLAASLRQQDRIIDPAHLRVLARLKRHSQTVSELAKMHKVSVASMSNTVQTMVIRGWIRRVALSTDRRRAQLELTEDGLAAMAKLQNLVALTIAEEISDLGEDERECLWGGLEILYAIFAPDEKAAECR